MLKKTTMVFFSLLMLAGNTKAGPVFNQDYVSSELPIYAGFLAGYGSTTWGQLVPAKDKQNLALSFSTPIDAHEGGGVWGLFVGYEFIPFFAVEGSYMHYPHSKVFFDPSSFFSFEHDDRTEFRSETEEVALIAKFLLPISHTKMRAFSNVGIASVHQKDHLKDSWGVHPTFGAGLNYRFTDHVMGDIGVDYTAGYGETEISPAENYIPFLYSAYVRLAYRFT